MSLDQHEARPDSSEEARRDKAFFDDNGYLGPFSVFPPETVEAMWKKVRVDLLDKTRAIYGDNAMNYDRHLDIRLLSDIVSHPDIVRRVQTALDDENILCWRTEWFPKYPGAEATAWHQAESFVAFEGDAKLVPTARHDGSWELTVWFAFTDATEETACLKLIPKTHHTWFFDETKNIPFNPDNTAGFYGYDFERLKIDPTWTPDESQALHIEMRAGEVLMFTSRCLHGSQPNVSKTKTRMGLAMRYVPADVRVYPYHTGQFTHFGEVFPLDNYRAMLVAGEDRYGHNPICRPLSGSEG
jgi:chlorinating enzyme